MSRLFPPSEGIICILPPTAGLDPESESFTEDVFKALMNRSAQDGNTSTDGAYEYYSLPVTY